jgi:hypothetical protein
MIYPNDEKNLNEPNVEEAIQRLEPKSDNEWSKMWLLQGTNKPW